MFYLVEVENKLVITKDCNDTTCKITQHAFMQLPYGADQFNAAEIVRALNDA